MFEGPLDLLLHLIKKNELKISGHKISSNVELVLFDQVEQEIPRSFKHLQPKPCTTQFFSKDRSFSSISQPFYTWR